MDDSYYMKQALLEAHKAGERGEVPVGAVVVCKDRIIARAHNLTETLTDVTAHAEMQAITAAAATLGGKYLNECTLYVTVEPCVMCAGAIAWAQMGRLVFGAEDEKRGYQRYASQALHPKTQVVKGILADECAALMKEFFAAKRTALTKKVAAALLAEGRVKLTGLYSEKTGGTYDATAVLEDTGESVRFRLEFDKGART